MLPAVRKRIHRARGVELRNADQLHLTCGTWHPKPMALLRTPLITLASVALAVGVAWLSGGHALALGGVPVTLWAVLVAFGLNWVAFVPAAIATTERFYDATGALTFLSVTVLALLTVIANDQPLSVTRLVPAILIVVWALRLGTFLLRRVHRVGKDGRFDEMKQQPARFFVAWTAQGLWVFLTSSAAVLLIAGAQPEGGPSPWSFAGWALWLFGFGFEVVADQQKAAFQRRKENSGRFIDVGVWSLSRHPNYLGEILLWLGLFVSGVGVYSGGAWVVATSPLFVAVLLLKVSGVPLLEERADGRWGRDPSYQAYKAKTPVLVPRLWPRRG